MKRKIKITLDVVMTALLFAVMAFPVTGEDLHEWLGIAMLVLFVPHHILNQNWHKNLFKGRFAPARWMYLIVYAALFFIMAGLVISGFLLSPIAFDLHIYAGVFARKLHMLSAAWGYLFMAAHIGLHAGILFSAGRKLVKKKVPVMLRAVLSAGVILYGIYEAAARQFFLKMFWLVDYAFYDFEEPAPLFFADYFFILYAFACIAYYLRKLAQGKAVRKGK